MALRAAAVVGDEATVPGGVVGLEHEVRTLVARRAALSDELDRLRRFRVRPRPPVAAQAHLRHKARPLDQSVGTRPTLLRLWSTVSAPLIFLAAAFLLLDQDVVVVSGVAAFVVVFLGIESVARRHFLAFATALVAVAVVGAIAIAAARGLLDRWNVVAAILLGVAALATLLANIRDLRR